MSCTTFDEWNTLGRRLVRRSVLSERQLRKALDRQKKLSENGDDVYLGDILVEMKYVDREVIDDELKAQASVRTPEDTATIDALGRLDEALEDLSAASKRLTTSVMMTAITDEDIEEEQRRRKSEVEDSQPHWIVG
jgi:hypothetical protein